MVGHSRSGHGTFANEAHTAGCANRYAEGAWRVVTLEHLLCGRRAVRTKV